MVPISNPLIVSLILIIVLAVPIIRNSPELNFALILGLLPVLSVIKQDTEVDILHYIIFIIVIKDFVIRKDYSIRKNLLAIYLVFLTWEFLHIYYYSITGTNFIYINNFVLFLTIFYTCLLSGRDYSGSYFESTLILFSMSMAFSFFYNLFSFPDNSGTNESMTLMMGNRLGGFGFNVNRYVGFVIVILASIPLALRRNILSPGFLLFLFVLFSVIGFLSGSRSYIMTYFILVTFILFFMSNRRENNSIKIVILITVLLIVSFSFINTSYIETFLNQVEDRSQMEKLGGYSRFDLLLYYFNYLIHNPGILLFGLGINSYFYQVGYVLFPHNLFIEPFLAWGLFGVIILIIFFTQIFKSNSVSSGNQQISFLTALPVICFFIQSLFSSPWAELDFYLIVAFCIRILFLKECVKLEYS